ncbi:hypothetical protein [Maridesulfovibrio sp.]|uniref:hypothetical protein n=1 Tax=Maridesulfovibrio sp. TaxID=2795000 RepID=UPI002AA7D66D|nr:hypothetical protein [Maridesulfovibrio sp.]
MKKLITILLLSLLVSCASKKPRLSQEELRRIRTQPVVVDISKSPETSTSKELPSHNGTINITKYSQTAEEKKQAKQDARDNVNQVLSVGTDILLQGVVGWPIPKSLKD